MRFATPKSTVDPASTTTPTTIPSLKKLRQQAIHARQWMKADKKASRSTKSETFSLLSECSSEVSYLNLGKASGSTPRSSLATGRKCQTRSLSNTSSTKTSGKQEKESSPDRESRRTVRKLRQSQRSKLKAPSKSAIDSITSQNTMSSLEKDSLRESNEYLNEDISNLHDMRESSKQIKNKTKSCREAQESILSEQVAVDSEDDYISHEQSYSKNQSDNEYFEEGSVQILEDFPAVDKNAELFDEAQDLKCESTTEEKSEANGDMLFQSSEFQRSEQEIPEIDNQQTYTEQDRRLFTNYVSLDDPIISLDGGKTPNRSREYASGDEYDGYKRWEGDAGIKELESRMGMQNRTIRALEEELRYSRKDSDFLTSKLERAHHDIKQLKAECSNLKSNSNVILASTQNNAAIVKELQCREKLSRKQVEYLESRIKELKQREQMNSNSSILKQAKSALKERDEALIQIKHLSHRIQSLQANSETSKHAQRKAQHRLSEQDAVAEALRLQLHKKSERLDKLRTEFAEASSTIKNLRLKIEKLEYNLEKALRSVRHTVEETVKCEAEKHEKIMRDAHARYFQVHSKLEELQDANSSLENANKRLQKRLVEVIQTNQNLTKESFAASELVGDGNQDTAGSRKAKAIDEFKYSVHDGSPIRKFSVHPQRSNLRFNDEDSHSSDSSNELFTPVKNKEHPNFQQSGDRYRSNHRDNRYPSQRSTPLKSHQVSEPTTDYAALMSRFKKIARYSSEE